MHFGIGLFIHMDWNSTIKGFDAYLKLEKSLSGNSIQAYLHDIRMLEKFLKEKNLSLSPEEIKLETLQDFIAWVSNKKMKDRSQARVISGVRAFYKFLLMEDMSMAIDMTLEQVAANHPNFVSQELLAQIEKDLAQIK